MRLGWDQRSRNAAELARRARSCRRAAHHRAWPHALPVLQGQRRLGRGARGESRASPSRSSSTATSFQRARRKPRCRPRAPMASWSDAAPTARRGCRRGSQRFLRRAAIPAPRSLAEQGAISRSSTSRRCSSHYGASLGLRNARKHVGWYLASSGRAAAIVKAWRQRLCTEDRSPSACSMALPHFMRKSWRRAA